jgi:hypothetical protein
MLDLGQVSAFTRNLAIPFIQRRPKCNVCKDFLALEAQASMNEIIIRSEKGCCGCRLLRDILNHFQVENTQDAWISFVAPTSYTSLYRLQSNVFWPLELFTTKGEGFHVAAVKTKPMLTPTDTPFPFQKIP